MTTKENSTANEANAHQPHSIWAVGRNYSEHAKELNNPVPTEPFFFLKSGASCVKCNEAEHKVQNLDLIQNLGAIHHEIEIALRIKKTPSGFDFSHLALALDLTAREKQIELKNQGLPWTLAKTFKAACPISDSIQLNESLKFSLKSNLQDFRFFFKINNIKKQFGNAEDMIFTPYQQLEFIQKYFPIQDGDLLLTGTPSGVGPLNVNDICEAQLRYKNDLLIDWKMKFN